MVFIQPFFEGTQNPRRRPATPLNLTINGDLYSCALLDDWKIFEKTLAAWFYRGASGGQSV